MSHEIFSASQAPVHRLTLAHFLSHTVTNTEDGNGPVQNMIGKALVARIVSAARAGKKFKVSVFEHVLDPTRLLESRSNSTLRLELTLPSLAPTSPSLVVFPHLLSQVIILVPEIPAFPGDLSAEGGLKAIMGAQYRSINRGGKSIMEQIAKEGFDRTRLSCSYLVSNLPR